MISELETSTEQPLTLGDALCGSCAKMLEPLLLPSPRNKSHDYQMLKQDDSDDADDTLSPRSIEMRKSSIIGVREFNVENILHSLASVNNFISKRNDQQQPIMLYEITSFGDSSYKTMILRDLLQYLNEEASDIDEDFTNEMFLRDERPITFSPPRHINTASLNFRQMKEKHSPITFSYKRSSSKSADHAKSPLSLMKRRSSVKRVPVSPLSSSTSNPLHANYGSFQPSTPPKQPPKQSTPLQFQARPTPPKDNHGNKKRRSSRNADCDCHLIRSLRLRDLRRLDASISLLNEAAVIVRRHSVIFAMVRLQKSDSCLIRLILCVIGSYKSCHHSE